MSLRMMVLFKNRTSKRFENLDLSITSLIVTGEKIIVISTTDIGMLQNIKHFIREFEIEREEELYHFYNSINSIVNKSMFWRDVCNDGLLPWKSISRLKMMFAGLEIQYIKAKLYQNNMDPYNIIFTIIVVVKSI